MSHILHGHSYPYAAKVERVSLPMRAGDITSVCLTKANIMQGDSGRQWQPSTMVLGIKKSQLGGSTTPYQTKEVLKCLLYTLFITKKSSLPSLPAQPTCRGSCAVHICSNTS